jgi:transcriptional regulator with XRE-family HTH domain
MVVMSTRIRVIDDARSRARLARIELGRQIRGARMASGVSIRLVARAIGRSTSWVSRVERGLVRSVSFEDLAVLAAAAGLRLWATTYPGARAIHDAPQVRLLRRFRERVGEAWAWSYEVVMPDARDQRAADCVIRNGPLSVMIEAFTRIADAQRMLREIHIKARDLGVTRVLIVLQASEANRRAMREVADIVRADYPLGTRDVLAALAEGRDPGANGIVVL